MTTLLNLLPVCDGCDEPVRGGHRIHPGELGCDLCGRKVYQTIIDNRVVLQTKQGPLDEIWIYAGPSTSKPPRWVGRFSTSGQTGLGKVPQKCLPQIAWDKSTCSVRLPDNSNHRIGLKVVKPSSETSTVETDCELPPEISNSLANHSSGLLGQLSLVGRGEDRAHRVRLLPRPSGDDALSGISILPDSGNPSQAEFVAYTDSDSEPKRASLKIRIVAPDNVPVMIRNIYVPIKKCHPEIVSVNANKNDYSKFQNQLLANGRELSFTLTIETKSIRPTDCFISLMLVLVGLPKVLYKLSFKISPKLELLHEPSPLPRQEIFLGESRDISLILRGKETNEDDLHLNTWLSVPESEPANWLKFLYPLPKPLTIPKDATTSVYLVVKTEQYNRTEFTNREMRADVFSKDQSGQVWVKSVQAILRRMPPMAMPLSLDWGTTNSCAAWHDGGANRPTTISLIPHYSRQESQEPFPSDIYFEDLRDPENPLFHIGLDARAIARDQNRSESILKSLKRRFVAGGTVYVTDRRDGDHTYPIDQLLRLILLRLLRMIEVSHKKEIGEFSLTFPTKWPAKVRLRLDAILNDVCETIKAQNGTTGPKVVKLPVRIDEANACALNFIQNLLNDESTDEAKEFVIASYDYGGGTIDTSVLRVTIDVNAAQPIKSTYLGIGGNADFGGDDVTRAIVSLIELRLKPWLEIVKTDTDTLRAATNFQFPLLPSGEAPNRDVFDPGTWYTVGRANWDALWQTADKIKTALCQDEWKEDQKPVEYHLVDELRSFECLQKTDQGYLKESLLDILPRAIGRISREQGGEAPQNSLASFYKAMEFTLEDVYEHPLEFNDRVKSTIRKRIDFVAAELKHQCTQANIDTPDYVVLAGGGCRLPLVKMSLKNALGLTDANIVYDPNYAKQRVAHGNAWYLSTQKSGIDLSRGLSASVDVLHRPLSIRMNFRKHRVIVPVGALVSSPTTWHSFDFPAYATSGELPRKLVLNVSGWREGGEFQSILGAFNLEDTIEALPIDPSTQSGPLPRDLNDNAAQPPQGHVRLRRNDANAIVLDLCVTRADARWGPFAFTPETPNPEEFLDLLQGVSNQGS